MDYATVLAFRETAVLLAYSSDEAHCSSLAAW